MRKHLISALLATLTALAVCGCSGFLRDEKGRPTTIGELVDAAASGAAAGATAGGPVGAGVGGLAGLLLGLLVAAKKDRELKALKKGNNPLPKASDHSKESSTSPSKRRRRDSGSNDTPPG